MPPVLIEIADNVATITLNRPNVLNAINIALAIALGEAIDAAERSHARAVLLRGAGRAFCAGGDVSAFDGSLGHAQMASETMAHFHPTILKLSRLRLPTVAELHGAVAGAGIGLLLACDFAIAEAGTHFTLAYPKIGASLDGGASWLLPRALGTRKAKELAMLADTFDAQTAKELGLINRVVVADAVRQETMRFCKRLASGPTLAFAEIKRLIDSSGGNDLSQQLDDERATLSALADGRDFQEGINAHMEKRMPVFRGG
jgi:2-(1,2-epoxy-1,2-dihydrophenyl)acetyl-CoA isomerase